MNWKRNLYIVWVCQFITMLGMASVVPFLPLFIRELGVTELNETAIWSGLIFAGPFFLSFFLAPVWGSMGDKYGRKIMVIRAVFGLALAQFIVGFSTDVTQLFLGRLLQGVLSGFIPAAMALIASNTPDEKIGYALGTLQSATATGNVIGPVIGGFLSDLIGFRNVFFFVSILLVLSGILFVIFVKEENTGKSEETISIRSNWMAMFQNKYLRISAILITLTSLGFSFIRPVFVLFVESISTHGENLSSTTGLLFSAMGVFSAFASTYWGKKVERSGIRRNIIITSFIVASMYTLQVFVPSISYLYPIMMLLGFGFGALNPLLFTNVSQNVEAFKRGGILGTASSFQTLGNMIGPVLGGYACGHLGFKSSFIITGLIFLSITATSIFTPLSKSKNNL